jgi:hypothetical protein
MEDEKNEDESVDFQDDNDDHDGSEISSLSNDHGFKQLFDKCCNHSNLRSKLQCRHPQKSLQSIHDWIDKDDRPIYCALSGMPIHQGCCIIVSRGLHVCYQHAELIATTFHTESSTKAIFETRIES